jgi:beta-glucanase (GH16 family)
VSRIYAPNKKGTTAGFFTMYAGAYVDWNSIEIELVPSVDQHPMSLDLSYGDGTTRIQEQTYHEGNFFDDWHTYSFEWTPQYVSFAVDGVEYKRYESSDPGVYMQYRP